MDRAVSMDDQSVELILPAGFQHKTLFDLFNGSPVIQIKNNKIKIALPNKQQEYISCHRTFYKDIFPE